MTIPLICSNPLDQLIQIYIFTNMEMAKSDLSIEFCASLTDSIVVSPFLLPE